MDRDRYGRPLVIPPDGGKPVPYTRCTTYVGCLEDTHNLTRWKQRQTVLGLTARPDLVMSAVANPDKANLDRVVDAAMEAAASSAAATIGTALHSLTEQHDRGTLDPALVPSDYRSDLDAYAAVTKCLTVKAIEQFGVHDELKIGGTWDRVVEHDGRDYIADVKTGDITYGIGKIAMQLAVYSRCVTYDEGVRGDLDVDQDRAIVIHLPAGRGEAFLWWVDIAAGWEAVNLATQVRAWRARRNLSEPFDMAKAPDTRDALDKLIDQCQSVAALRTLWAADPKAWTPAHTARATARADQLRKGTR